MSWGLSVGQSTNLATAVAGVALLQQAAASFYPAKFLSRCVRPMLGVLLFLVISVTSTITFAEEPSPVQKAAENYYPKIAKKFPPNRKTTCEECKKKQEDLNVAWQELYRFDQDHPDVRTLESVRKHQ